MASVTKDMLVGDIIDKNEKAVPFLLDIGMHCLGCPASRGETMEEACMVHGIEADEVVEKLNEYLLAAE